VIDSIVTASQFATGCDLTVEPAGLRLDVNGASEGELQVLFRSVGLSIERTDSVIDAILDWRDRDDEPRRFGAERAWYEEEGRIVPRNDSFASAQELRFVRGLENLASLDSLLGVEPQRIWLERAPLAVIRTLPGMNSEAIALIGELRQQHTQIGDLLTLQQAMTPNVRDSLMAHYAELISRTTLVPEAWTLTARSTTGSPPAVAVLQLRLAPAGSRAAIMRRVIEQQ
jgi:type II secretory pathway component PulK